MDESNSASSILDKCRSILRHGQRTFNDLKNKAESILDTAYSASRVLARNESFLKNRRNMIYHDVNHGATVLRDAAIEASALLKGHLQILVESAPSVDDVKSRAKIVLEEIRDLEHERFQVTHHGGGNLETRLRSATGGGVERSTKQVVPARGKGA
jgi:hypothetical protein